MRHMTLIAASDEYDSKPGFMIKGANGYDGAMADRGEGILIAHDIIEHQNGIAAIGPIWDEMQALGGIWHARGQWGDMMSDAGSAYSPAQNVAGDITRMARDLAFADSWFDQMGRAPITRRHLYDDDFLEIIEYARRDIPGELDDDTPLDVERYLSECLSHMRIGYNKANRRFRQHRFASNEAMHNIKEAVQRAANLIEFEGQEFRLSWCIDRCTIDEIWERD